MSSDDRYQYQNIFVKIWRCRHFLPLPYRAVTYFLSQLEEDGADAMTFEQCWSVERGMVDVKRRYTYTLDELQ